MGKLDKVVEGYAAQARELRERLAMYEHHYNVTKAELSMIEARIAGIREAEELLQGEVKAQAAPTAKRSRRLTGHWRAIIRAVSLLRQFSYEDLESAVAAVGHKAGRDTLRSQMSLYKASGLVEPTDDGNFRVTEKGKLAAGIDPQAEPEDTFVDADTDDVPFAPLEAQPASEEGGWPTWTTKHG